MGIEIVIPREIKIVIDGNTISLFPVELLSRFPLVFSPTCFCLFIKTSRLALFITDDGTSSLETYLETYILTSFMSFNYRLSQHYRLCLMA